MSSATVCLMWWSRREVLLENEQHLRDDREKVPKRGREEGGVDGRSSKQDLYRFHTSCKPTSSLPVPYDFRHTVVVAISSHLTQTLSLSGTTRRVVRFCPLSSPISRQNHPPPRPKSQSQPTPHQAQSADGRHRSQKFQILIQNQSINRTRESNDSRSKESFGPYILWGGLFSDQERNGVDELFVWGFNKALLLANESESG